jgi:hypothetical protein
LDRFLHPLVALTSLLALRIGPACATTASTAPPPASAAAETGTESLSDAWWTGPLLAPTAATLPEGHFYFEPYLYDSLPYAQFDSQGRAHPVPGANDLGSLTYVNYGVTDRLAIGVIPRFGYDWVDHGQSSSTLGLGDPSVQVQYRLTQFQPGSWVPTFSINLQESLPAGRYDRLTRPTDGFGSGAYTTTLSTYFQSYFWMPSGRILRARLDVSYAVPSQVSLEDSSVYGTPAGFRGHAQPGDSAFADLAFEYSATRNWVPAFDIWLERDGNTRVWGDYQQPSDETVPFFAASGVGRELILAPALEYNWSSRVGVIFGARIIAAGRNETGFVTPVAAFSCFL